MADNLIEKKEWGEFQSTGLLLIINQILHVFGWAIVFSVENGVVKEVFPARVKFRGFDNDSVTDAYARVTNYLKRNIDDLHKETID